MKYKYLGWIAAVVLSALFIACAKDETAIPDPGPEPDTEPSYDPDTERGWYDAPYIRYEAEPGFCSSNGSFLAPSDRIPDVQSEATNQTALSLAAPGDWVEWTCQKAAEGMVIRFSIPDAPEGGGTKGILALYVDGEKIRDIELDSYHAWQYKKPGAGPYLWYFDNTPAPDKYARMQYDDKRVLLEEKIPAGATFRLVKEDAGAGPYTIDFVELEPVPAPLNYLDLMDGSTVCYHPQTDGPLNVFIELHQGHSIFIPAGRYEFDWGILLSSNTKLIGAGSWYTELYFRADPNDPETINRRGFFPKTGDAGNSAIKHLYMDTALERRYLNYHGGGGLNGNPPGKVIDGRVGDDFVMEDVWAEHFETGPWITVGKNMRISKCRFRNYYADGLHVFGGENGLVERCDLRNNGDDNLALENWADKMECRHITIECGWRAGGIAFLGEQGGGGYYVHNLLVKDMFEVGIRIFGTKDSQLCNTTFERCGARGGEGGIYGDIAGNAVAAVHIESMSRDDVCRVKFSNVDVKDSRWDAFNLQREEKYSTKFDGVVFENVLIDGWQGYGVHFGSYITGDIGYRNLVFQNGAGERQNEIPETLNFHEISADAK